MNIQSLEIFTVAAKLKVLVFTLSEVGALLKAHIFAAGQNQGDLTIPVYLRVYMLPGSSLHTHKREGSAKVAATRASVKSNITFTILDLLPVPLSFF